MDRKPTVVLSDWAKLQFDSDCTLYLKSALGGEGSFGAEVDFTETKSYEWFAELARKLDQAYKFGFAAVVITPAATAVISDRNRSIPVFYHFHSGTWSIASSIESLASQGPHSISMDAYAEFWISGFITSGRTLLKEFGSVDAGEFHILRNGRSRKDMMTWYTYAHQLPILETPEAVHNALQTNLDSIFSEIALRCSEKLICVPLSGGFDSRLIATMLKRHGLKNVLCFSYGVDNSESKVSEIVAKSLGFEWKFYETTEDDWKIEFDLSHVKRYQLMGSNLCSTAHLQDWLAVKKLVKEVGSDQDMVFVPGHSGDFLAGSHLPDFLFSVESTEVECLTDYLISAHHSMNPHPAEHLTREKLKSVMKKTIPWFRDLKTLDSFRAASSLDTWNWKHRQSKVIINSVRVYEFFGCDWLLPLWHADFMDLWAHTKLPLKRERRLYNEYVSRIYEDSVVESTYYKGGNARALPNSLYQMKKIAKLLGLSQFLGKIYHYFSGTNLTDDDLGWRGRYTSWPIDDLIRKGYTCDVGFNVVSFLSELDDVIDMIERDAKK